MKSTKNTRAVLVGIFIFLALVIFIVGVLTLGGQRKTFADTIDVSATFDDVNGLQRGSNIWYAGVKIGTIKSLGFDKNGGVDVKMSIEEASQQYIHKDTKAKVGTDGLIGNKIIVLYGGSQQAPVIADGDVLTVEKSAGMDEMMNTLQTNNKNILDITNDFKVISHRLANGEGTVGKLLKEETLANDLNATLAALNRATQNAERLTNQLASYAANLQKPGTLTNDLITDTVIFSKLRSSVSQIEEVTTKANAVMSTMQTASTNLSADLNKSTTPAGVLLRDEEAGANLKAAIKNLQTSTKKLDDNMEALQHNFLLRGFFKKKAKDTL
ncbi:MAG: MlaD family protein [Flavisolibacter sp.]|jgi:phospholipid/cholesterol/gamma-HCH transport system substrate-binding protein